MRTRKFDDERLEKIYETARLLGCSDAPFFDELENTPIQPPPKNIGFVYLPKDASQEEMDEYMRNRSPELKEYIRTQISSQFRTKEECDFKQELIRKFIRTKSDEVREDLKRQWRKYDEEYELKQQLVEKNAKHFPVFASTSSIGGGKFPRFATTSDSGATHFRKCASTSGLGGCYFPGFVTTSGIGHFPGFATTFGIGAGQYPRSALTSGYTNIYYTKIFRYGRLAGRIFRIG